MKGHPMNAALYGLRRPDGSWGSWLYSDAAQAHDSAVKDHRFKYEAVPLAPLPKWHLSQSGVWDALPQVRPEETAITEDVWLALASGEVVPGHCVISTVGGVRRWRSTHGYEIQDVIGWCLLEVPKHPTAA